MNGLIAYAVVVAAAIIGSIMFAHFFKKKKNQGPMPIFVGLFLGIIAQFIVQAIVSLVGITELSLITPLILIIVCIVPIIISIKTSLEPMGFVQVFLVSFFFFFAITSIILPLIQMLSAQYLMDNGSMDESFLEYLKEYNMEDSLETYKLGLSQIMSDEAKSYVLSSILILINMASPVFASIFILNDKKPIRTRNILIMCSCFLAIENMMLTAFRVWGPQTLIFTTIACTVLTAFLALQDDLPKINLKSKKSNKSK